MSDDVKTAPKCACCKIISGLVLLLVLVGGGCAVWLYGHHVIQTRQGRIVMEKRFLTFKDSWVDVRAWTSKDFAAHPVIKQALIRGGYGDMIQELRYNELRQSVTDLAQQANLKLEELKTKMLTELNNWINEAETNWFPKTGGATNTVKEK